MLPRTMIVLRCNNQTTANTAATGLTTLLIGKGIAVQDTAPTVALEDGVWTMRADIRFLNRADAEAWYALAVAELGTNKMLTGSSVSIHNCPHDDPVNAPCVIDTVGSK